MTLIIGFVCGDKRRVKLYETNLNEATRTAEGILKDARKEAAAKKKEAILEAKEESHRYRSEVEKELRGRRSEVQRQENRLIQREENLDRKDALLEKREQSLDNKEDQLSVDQQKIDHQRQKVTELIQQQHDKLEEVASLTTEQARKEIMQKTKANLTHELGQMIKDSEDEARARAEQTAKDLIAQAIERSAADTVSESTVSVVTLPNNDMKGRIIGKEGRNVRTFETLTGIDLIIDDTPDTVLLSGFDPVRREIARMAQIGRAHV